MHARETGLLRGSQIKLFVVLATGISESFGSRRDGYVDNLAVFRLFLEVLVGENCNVCKFKSKVHVTLITYLLRTGKFILRYSLSLLMNTFISFQIRCFHTKFTY